MGVLLSATLAGLAGCTGPSITASDAPTLPTSALATVTAFPAASIIAVGGTQQLSAAGATFAGDIVTAFDSVVFQFANLADSNRVKLSSSGQITGLAAGNNVLINVLGFKGAAVRGDQVVVQVTPTAVSGLTFSIQPVAPDSAKLAAGTTKTIVPLVKNSSGQSVTNPAVIYKIRGSDSTRVDTFRGNVAYRINAFDNLPVRTRTANTSLATNQIVALAGEGTAWLYATISAYGQVLSDSVQYTFTYPYTQTLTTTKTNLAVTSLYQDQIVTLAPGAVVTFANGVASTDPLTMTYTFDNPAAATAPSPASTIGGASGNVTTLTGGQSSRRQFLTPGTYHWTVTPTGGPAPWPGQVLAGTIVIK